MQRNKSESKRVAVPSILSATVEVASRFVQQLVMTYSAIIPITLVRSAKSTSILITPIQLSAFPSSNIKHIYTINYRYIDLAYLGIQTLASNYGVTRFIRSTLRYRIPAVSPTSTRSTFSNPPSHHPYASQASTFIYHQQHSP